MKSQNEWSGFYSRREESLAWPDENLVRMLSSYRNTHGTDALCADIGCGQGRHTMLLEQLGFSRHISADYSMEALRSFSRFPALDNSPRVQCDITSLPLRDESLDICIAWGSLHYARKSDTERMIEECARVLRNGGAFFATLRSWRDTFVTVGKEIEKGTWITSLPSLEGATVSVFDEEEVRNLASLFGGDVAIGLSERTLMNRLDTRISHWVIDARRSR